jgi:hypothetical protein
MNDLQYTRQKTKDQATRGGRLRRGQNSLRQALGVDWKPLIYSFWLCLWYLLAIVLTVLLWYTASGYAFGIFWPLYWLSSFHLQLLIIMQWSKYAEGITEAYIKDGQSIQWPKDTKGITRSCISKEDSQYPLYWLSSFDIQLLVMPLVSFGHFIDCPPLIYSFWLCLWYLLAIVLYQRRTVNTMVKRYQRHTQKPYIKEGQSIQWPTDTKGITRIRIYCIDCNSLIYCFWLCLWYL